MSWKYFDIEIRDAQLLPLQATDSDNIGWNFSQNDKIFLHFDLCGYKQIRTQAIDYPWKWTGYIQRTLFGTRYYNLFSDRYLIIYCTKYKKWRLSDKIVAKAEIDFFTLATGAKWYEMLLLHPTHQYPICSVKFYLSMIQISQNITVKLRNVNITSAYNRLLPILQKGETVNVFCGYIDPAHLQWQSKMYSLQLQPDNNNTNTNALDELVQANIKELKLKLPMYILSSNFMKASIHIVFWKGNNNQIANTNTKKYDTKDDEDDEEEEDENEILDSDLDNARDSGDDDDDDEFKAKKHKQKQKPQLPMSQELGRVVIPVLGNYDSERQHMKVSENILWNEQNMKANHIAVNNFAETDSIQATLSFQNGPQWSQLYHGKYTSHRGIQGEHFIGFPIPINKEIEVETFSADISQFIREHALYLENLKLARYNGDFPEWFLIRKPNSYLLKHYYYETKADTETAANEGESLKEQDNKQDNNNNNKAPLEKNSTLPQKQKQKTLVSTSSTPISTIHSTTASIETEHYNKLQQLCSEWDSEQQKYEIDRWHLLEMFTSGQLNEKQYSSACTKLFHDYRVKQYELRFLFDQTLTQYYNSKLQ